MLVCQLPSTVPRLSTCGSACSLPACLSCTNIPQPHATQLVCSRIVYFIIYIYIHIYIYMYILPYIYIYGICGYIYAYTCKTHQQRSSSISSLLFFATLAIRVISRRSDPVLIFGMGFLGFGSHPNAFLRKLALASCGRGDPWRMLF